MAIPEPSDPVPDRPGTRLLGWALDIALGAVGGLLVGFVIMVAVERLGWGTWSVLPPLGVLAGMVLLRWDRDRVPHPGKHRAWVLVAAVVLAVASVAFFTALVVAISNFE